jgi:hypothetical protein
MVVIYLCDNCNSQIKDGVHKIDRSNEDFCSRKCAEEKVRGVQPEECQHEDNMSDQAAGRSTARLICKTCGYDRVEEVA